MDVGDIRFGQAVRELGEARRRFEQDGQHTGRERIERAGVAYAMRPSEVAKPPDDLKGRLPRGLVDVEDTCRKRC